MAGRQGRRNSGYGRREWNKPHTAAGVASFIVGLLALLMFPGMAAVSFFEGGGAGVSAAGLCVIAMLLAILGIFLSKDELQRENVKRILPKLGMFFSVLALVAWILVILVGLA